MGRFQRSVELAKQSWAVLKTDKELMVIPVVGFLVTVVVGVLVGAGVFLTLHESTQLTTNSLGGTYEATTLEPSPVTFVVGAVGLYLLTFVSIFFSAVLVAGAYERLTGGNPSLGSAFSRAASRLPQIMGWTVLAGTVNLILSQIENRGIIGAVVGNLFEAAWRVATWLAVPVIIVEGPGPWTSLKRAATLFKQTWGENLIAQAGFGLIGFLAFLPGILLAVGLGALVPVAGVLLGVIWLCVVATVLSALTGIFKTALYLYATGHQNPWFDQQLMAASFGPKTGLRR